MSFEAINDFFKGLDTHPDIVDEFEALDKGENFHQLVVELANKHGFDFTLEELMDVVEVAKRIREKETQHQQESAEECSSNNATECCGSCGCN